MSTDSLPGTLVRGRKFQGETGTGFCAHSGSDTYNNQHHQMPECGRNEETSGLDTNPIEAASVLANWQMEAGSSGSVDTTDATQCIL